MNSFYNLSREDGDTLDKGGGSALFQDREQPLIPERIVLTVGGLRNAVGVEVEPAPALSSRVLSS